MKFLARTLLCYLSVLYSVVQGLDSENCPSTTSPWTCGVGSSSLTCYCIFNLAADNTETIITHYQKDASSTTNVLKVYGTNFGIRMFQFNDDTSVPTSGFNYIGEFNIASEVENLVFYYVVRQPPAPSTDKYIQLGMIDMFFKNGQSQYVNIPAETREEILGNLSTLSTGNQQVQTKTYTIQKEFQGFRTAYSNQDRYCANFSNNYNNDINGCFWALLVLDQLSCSDITLTMPSVGINTNTARFLVNDNRTVSTNSDNYYVEIGEATQSSSLWNNCQIKYLLSVTSDATAQNLSLIVGSRNTAWTPYKNRVYFRKSYDEDEAGTYTLEISAKIEKVPGSKVSTTVQALYQSCTQTTLIPSSTIANIQTSVLKGEVCVDLPTWSDQFSIDYGYAGICGDFRLMGTNVTDQYYKAYYNSNGTNVSWPLNSNNLSDVNDTKFCINPTSNTQSTNYTSSDFIQVALRVKVKNYDMVKKEVGFQIVIEWCQEPNLYFIGMSIGGQSLDVYSSIVSGYTITQRTLRNIQISLPAVTPVCGYNARLNYIKPFEDPDWKSNQQNDTDYSIELDNNLNGNIIFRIWVSIEVQDAFSLPFNLGRFFRFDYLIPSSLASQTIYANETSDFYFKNFTTSFSNTSPQNCANIVFTAQISSSNSAFTASVSVGSSGDSYYVRCISAKPEDAGTATITVIGTQTPQQGGSCNSIASFSFDLTLKDPCEKAYFVSSSGQPFANSEISVSNNDYIELGTDALLVLTRKTDSVSQPLANGVTSKLRKYCSRTFTIDSYVCQSVCTQNLTSDQFNGTAYDSSNNMTFAKITTATTAKSLIGTHRFEYTEVLVASGAILYQYLDLKIRCTLTSYTITAIADQTITIFESALYWTFPISNVVQTPTYCLYSQQLSYTADSMVQLSTAAALDQSLSFQVAAITDQTKAGSYTVYVTSSIQDSLATVNSTTTATRSFTVIVADPCATSSISASTASMSNLTIYIGDSTKTLTLPTFTDSYSTIKGDSAFCKLYVEITVASPNSGASTNWITTSNQTSTISLNPSTTTYTQIYSWTGPYVVTVVAKVPYSTLSLTKTYTVSLADPCNYSSLTQPTVPDMSATFYTAPTKTIVVTFSIPTSSSSESQNQNCDPVSYGIIQTSTTQLNTTYLRYTNSINPMAISLDVTSDNNMVGTYPCQVVLNLKSGQTINLPFTISINPCQVTSVSTGGLPPTVSDFALVYSVDRILNIPLTLSQHPPCGYPYSLYYAVNGTINSTKMSNLQVDLSNQNQALITFRQSVDGANFGMHQVNITAATVVPSSYSAATSMQASVSFNQSIIIDCNLSTATDIFVVASNFPSDNIVKTVYIGNETTILPFSDYTDSISNQIGISNACGAIKYRYYLNGVDQTDTIKTSTDWFNMTTGLSAPNQNQFSVGQQTCCITPTFSTIGFKAYIPSTKFETVIRSFYIQIIDPCESAAITNTAGLNYMQTSVLKLRTQSVLNFFSDNVTDFYKTTTKYSCGTLQLIPSSYPTQTGVASLGSSDFFYDSSTSEIKLSPTLATQVGAHAATLTVSLSNYPSRTRSFSFTLYVDYCVITSYLMAVATTTIEYTLTGNAFYITYQNQNAQTPSCGYVQQFSYSTSNAALASIITGSAINSNGDFQFQVAQSTNRTLAGVYSITLTSSVQSYNYTTSLPTPSANTIKLVIYDACKDTVLVQQTVQDLDIYVWNWDYSTQTTLTNNYYTPVSSFTDTVSNSQNNASYCGAITYSLTATNTIPAGLSLTSLYVVNSVSPQIYAYSGSMAQTGNYTVQITGKLNAFNNVTLMASFKIVVYNPCYWTQVQVPTYLDLKSTVLAPNHVSTPSPSTTPIDTLSKKIDGVGTQTCGPRTFTITSNDTSNLNSQNGLSIDSSTGKVTLAPLYNTQVGYYLVQVNITLDNYTKIINTTSFKVQVQPCRILSVAMDQVVDQYYELHPNNTWVLNYNRSQVVQQRACNYTQSFSFSTNQTQATSEIQIGNSTDSAQSFVQMSLKSTNRGLLLNSTQQYDDRVFSVTLTVQLVQCLDQTYCTNRPNPSSDPALNGASSQSITFNLIIKDPCKRAYVYNMNQTESEVENFHSFAGYNVTSLTSYLFSDNVTESYNITKYCGLFNMTFNETDTKNSYPEMNGTNGNLFTFSPSASSKNFTTKQITLHVFMIQYYPSVNLSSNFNATTLGYVSPVLPDQIYYISSSAITFYSSEYQILPKGFTAPDMIQTGLELYKIDLTAFSKQLKFPVNLTELNGVSYTTLLQNSSLTAVPKWFYVQINLNNGTMAYKIETNLSALENTEYQFLLVQDYPSMNQNITTTFRVSLVKMPVAKRVIPPPDFVMPLENQIIACDQEGETYNWVYKLPNAVSSTAGVTVKQILGTCTTDNVQYIQNKREIQQVKFVPKGLNAQCTFILTDSEQNQNKKFMQLSFTCAQPVKEFSQDQLDALLRTQTQAKQLTSPGATIQFIEKSGLVTILFNTTMKIPERPFEIRNGTVYIDNNIYPTVELSVIPGKDSNISNLDFNWTFVEFTQSNLKLQVTFSHPNYVSSQKDKDQLKVVIYGNYLFADSKGNMMKQGTVLNKTLPKVALKSMADKMTSLGIDTSNGVLSVLFTNTIMTILVAGPINLILGAIKQLQITSHIMLINVSTPANLNIFFSLLMQLITLNFIDTTDFVNKMLKLDVVSPFSDQFSEVGYGSLYVLQNLGTLAFMMIGIPPLMGLAYLFIKLFRIKSLENMQRKIANYLCFDGTISFLYETILLIAICGMLNLDYFKWDTVGNAVNSSIAVIFLGICAVFPVFVARFYSKPQIYQKIEGRDEGFFEQFGSILQGLNFLRRGRQVIIYLVTQMYRKIILSITCIFLFKYPLFSIFSQMIVSVTMIIAQGFVEPLTDQVQNQMELLNEFFVLLHLYHSLCFTDFQPHLDWRDKTGFSLIAVTVANIGINLGVVTIITLAQSARKAKLTYLQTKQRLALKKRRDLKQKEIERKLKEAQKRLEEEENRKNQEMWERKLKEEEEAMEKAKREQQIELEKQVYLQEVKKLQDKEKKLKEKQDKEAHRQQQIKLNTQQYDHLGFPIPKPVDISLLSSNIKPQATSAQKLITQPIETELIYPYQSGYTDRQGPQPYNYDYNSNTIAQLQFSEPKPKPVVPRPKPVQRKENLPQPIQFFSPEVYQQAREEWERANPEAALQRDELIEETKGWSKYPPGHYMNMEDEPQITDPRFIGPDL